MRSCFQGGGENFGGKIPKATSAACVTLPDIEFEGVTVKPKRGVYRCPFDCGDKRFGPPSWKTEAGFRKHMARCYQRPSAIAKRTEKTEADEREQQAAVSKRQTEAFAKLTHKIGDEIFFVCETILKPTHVMRGGRMRRVRYEEEKHFSAGRAIIMHIGFDGWQVIFNHGIKARTLKASMTEAEKHAAESQRAYDEHVKFSSFCR